MGRGVLPKTVDLLLTSCPTCCGADARRPVADAWTVLFVCRGGAAGAFERRVLVLRGVVVVREGAASVVLLLLFFSLAAAVVAAVLRDVVTGAIDARCCSGVRCVRRAADAEAVLVLRLLLCWWWCLA